MCVAGESSVVSSLHVRQQEWRSQDRGREGTTSWIAAAWDDIPAELVVKSFRKCCISNALDGTDDHALWEVDSDKDTSEDDE